MKTQVQRSTRHQDADGFTLPEVLITMVMLGIISTVMVGIAAVVFRTTPPTEARADDARSMLGLVTWLPQDVDSTPTAGFSLDPNRDDCGSGVGTSILHLTWSEDLGGGKIFFVANYRHVPRASGFALNRVLCNGPAMPYANGFTQNVTSELPDLPAGWVPGNAPLDVDITMNTAGTEVELVTFALTTLSGEVVTADSASKNPAETLPTTTLPAWYIPTPTTAVFTNTPPTASSPTISAYPSPAFTSVSLVVYDADGHSMVVQLVPSSIPSGWAVTLTSTSMSVSPAFGSDGTTGIIEYTVDDQNGGVTSGFVTVNVVGTASTTTTTLPPATTTTVVGPTTTTLAPACVVTGTGLSRTSVKNVAAVGNGNGQVSSGVLFKSVVVSATTNGYCPGMEIRYVSGGVNSPSFINMTQTGPTSWEVLLPGKDEGSSETWPDGFHDIFFHSATGGPWNSVTLQVT